MDQGGQAGGEDDPPLLPPFPLQPSTARAEPAGLQPGEFVAAADVAQAHRELVADELAAAAGENGWKVSETCPLLLATVGGEPPDETVVCQHAPADCRAVASGRIAGAAGTEKSIQSQEGTEECLTKPDGKALVSSSGTLVVADGTPCRAKENVGRWETSMGKPNHRRARS